MGWFSRPSFKERADNESSDDYKERWNKAKEVQDLIDKKNKSHYDGNDWGSDSGSSSSYTPTDYSEYGDLSD